MMASGGRPLCDAVEVKSKVSLPYSQGRRGGHSTGWSTGIEHLWGAKVGTPEGDRLDVLATLIDAHESEHDPIDPSDPIEAIKFRDAQ
ncbi:MAG: hypothetical protein ACR65T_15545 [Methylocystis sp.]|jgi:hypothetical protein|uniref:hypothetical protein n=1 Tax=Methylocystis sp. TaxID=1911079 RepID=UPI003DA4FB0C